MGSPQDHTNKMAFYGTATIGTKGQIVIPAEAREEMNLRPGDKVAVLGLNKDANMLGVCPLSSVERMLERMSEHIERMKKAVEDNKKERTI